MAYTVTLSDRAPTQQTHLRWSLTFRRRRRAVAFGRALGRVLLQHNGLNWHVGIFRNQPGEVPDLTRPLSSWSHQVVFAQGSGTEDENL